MGRETYPVQQTSNNDQSKVVFSHRKDMSKTWQKTHSLHIFIFMTSRQQKTNVGQCEVNLCFFHWPTNHPSKKRKATTSNNYKSPSLNTQTLRCPPALSLCPHRRPPISCGRPASTSRDTCLRHSIFRWLLGLNHPNSMMDLWRCDGHISIFFLKNSFFFWHWERSQKKWKEADACRPILGKENPEGKEMILFCLWE